MTLFDYLKNIFLILIFLQLAPMLLQGIKKQYKDLLEPKTKVGVLKIKGVLYDSSYYTKQLTKYFKDTDIKGILIKMNCFGGAAGTGQIIFSEIQELKKQYPKPIVVSVENVCASSAYLISCACDYIIAPGSAIIGSIGSYFSSIQLKEFLDQFKVKFTTVKAGTYKTIGDPFTDMTEDEKQLLQNVQYDAYQQFVQVVANNRKLSLATAPEWADGKIFTGQQALKLNLIDKIGSAQHAIRVLKEKALIEGEIEWVQPPAQGGLLKLITGESPQDEALLSTALQKISTLSNAFYGYLRC